MSSGAWGGGCVSTDDRQFAEQQVQVGCVLHVQGYEGEGLASKFLTHGESLLDPLLFVGSGGLVEHFQFHGLSLLAFGREQQVYVGRALGQLVAEGHLVAIGQGILRLEEVEVLVGGRAAQTERRSTEPSVVPSEVGVKARGGHVGCVVAKELVGEPPAPCGQIVLHTDVVPLAGILTLSIEIEESTVAKVEIGDERLLGEVPRQGAAGGHESRHAVPAEIVGRVVVAVNDFGTVGGIAGAAGEVALNALQVGGLLHGRLRSLLAASLPEHIVGVGAPKTNGETVVGQKTPRRASRFASLHVDTAVEIERVTSHLLCVGHRVFHSGRIVPVII